VKQNFTKSGKWLYRAKKRRASGADFELALFFRDGSNPARDDEKAAFHLSNALSKNDPRACLLAARHKLNRGLPTRKALKNLICAAEGGIVPAMLILASYYEQKNSPNALYKSRTWLDKASAAGSSRAWEQLYPLP